MLKQSALRYVLASSTYPGFIILRTEKQLCVVTAALIYNMNIQLGTVDKLKVGIEIK